MEYKFNGKLTLDDFVQTNRFYMRETLLKGKVAVIFFVAIIFFLGSFIYGIILYNRIRFLEDLLPVLIFGLVILFVIKRPKIMYKKYFEKDKISQEEQTFIVNENEINMSSENSYIKITKDKINKIKYDKNSIYIFISENKLCIIKSRYLKDLTEFNELKDFIKLNYREVR
ncbi:MAG: hypothetical protein LBB89_08600 [Treponema sp.]|jgi:hypothetical protein|nr:hypothetical protein [Treponema sp.]